MWRWGWNSRRPSSLPWRHGGRHHCPGGTAAVIIALAALVGAGRALLAFVRPSRAPDAQKESLRLELARWLAVALEFTLAADILRTAIAPSWDDIGKLAAIATLRTLLNYFLQREIDGHQARQEGAAEEAVSRP